MSVSTATGSKCDSNTTSSPTINLHPTNTGSGGITIGTVGIQGSTLTGGCTAGGSTATSDFGLDFKMDGMPGGKKMMNLQMLGADASTYSPFMNLNENMLGASPATWSPMQNLMDGADESSYSPFMNLAGRRGATTASWSPNPMQNLNMLGASSATWSPMQNLIEAGMGGVDSSSWSPYPMELQNMMLGSNQATWAPELQNLKFGRRLKKAATKVGKFTLDNGPQLVKIVKAIEAL